MRKHSQTAESRKKANLFRYIVHAWRWPNVVIFRRRMYLVVESSEICAPSKLLKHPLSYQKQQIKKNLYIHFLLELIFTTWQPYYRVNNVDRGPDRAQTQQCKHGEDVYIYVTLIFASYLWKLNVWCHHVKIRLHFSISPLSKTMCDLIYMRKKNVFASICVYNFTSRLILIHFVELYWFQKFHQIIEY